MLSFQGWRARASRSAICLWSRLFSSLAGYASKYCRHSGQKDPNEDLLDYVRGGSPVADSVGRRKSLMKLVKDEFEK